MDVNSTKNLSGDPMKHSFFTLAVASLCFFSLSCNETSVGVAVPQGAAELIRSFQNVPWRLTYAQVAGSAINFSTYRPFELFIRDDSTLFANDDCNYYYIGFRISGDSLAVTSISATEAACPDWTTFDGYTLRKTWKVIISPHLLMFASGSTFLQLMCDFTAPVDKNPLVGKTWLLHASNDTAFHVLQEVGYLPTLQLTPNREYRLWWRSDCGPGTDGRIGFGGYFGCNADSGILFREYNGGICGFTPVPYQDMRTLSRGFELSSGYRVADSTATFTDSSAGTFYQFVRSE